MAAMKPNAAALFVPGAVKPHQTIYVCSQEGGSPALRPAVPSTWEEIDVRERGLEEIQVNKMKKQNITMISPQAGNFIR